MKEIFTEEEYQNAVIKYNERVRNDLFNNITFYSSYDGYVDLRELNLSEDDFKILWRWQDLLYSYEHSNNCSKIINKIYQEMKAMYLNCFLNA